MAYPRIYKFLNTSGASSYTATNVGSKMDKPYTDLQQAVVQSVGVMSAGSGSAVIAIQGSCDNTNWLTIGTITLSLTTSSTSDGFAFDAPWPYLRANVTTLTTNGSVTTYLGV